MKLPTYRQLIEEQDSILNIPLDESCLVSGPPGTGKTVMALYRAQQLQKAGKKVVLLSYNKLLSQYTSSAVTELKLESTQVKTFHRWFAGWYKRNYHRWPPGKDYVHDWTAILTQINEKAPRFRTDECLIVDEGQDLPPSFYLVARVISPQYSIFADENQRMGEHNSTIDQIRLSSGIQDKQEYRLTVNHRNTAPVAKVAAHFYCGLPTGIPVLPKRTGPKPEMHAMKNLKETVEFIARFVKNRPKSQVGIFTPTTSMQNEIYKLMRARLPSTSVQRYASGQEEEVDFEVDGVFIVNYPSTKGLEFDAVFIPELQCVRIEDDWNRVKMRFYVMAARARQWLYFMYSGEKPAILENFPDDEHLAWSK